MPIGSSRGWRESRCRTRSIGHSLQIGFGEIPNAFSEQQRLWTLVCIYLSVIGWAVFIGKLLQISADANLQRAIRTSRFARAVRKLREPFYIVCGYGETGRLICHALDQLGYRVVVLELNGEHLAELELPLGAVDSVCLACAGPVSGDLFRFTNNHWRISRAAFCRELQVRELLLVNDFSAMALGMTRLKPDEFRVVCPGTPEPLRPAVGLPCLNCRNSVALLSKKLTCIASR